MTTLVYGSANLTGYMGADTVCLDKTNASTCANSQCLFMITKDKNLSYDGILGLSPNNSKYSPSFVGSLASQGKLSDDVVSFWMNDSTQESYVTFGGKMAEGYRGEFVSANIVSSYEAWWTIRLHNTYYGENSIKESAVNYAIIDTGTSFLYLAQTDYANFIDVVKDANPDLNCLNESYCFSQN